jgi:hypothetical protein
MFILYMWIAYGMIVSQHCTGKHAVLPECTPIGQFAFCLQQFLNVRI